MHTFLIVGKNFSNLRDKILERGDEYVLLQDKLATKFPNRSLKRRVVADFSSKEKLLEISEQLRGKVDGLVCMYENYILPAAWLAKHLGLPGLPVASAEACTDKYLMRQLFANAPEKISPDYNEVSSEQDLRAFAENHDFPLILKPANLAKSLLITKCHDLQELLSVYRNTLGKIDVVYNKYAPHRAPKLIVEEFMEGSVHSVDAFISSQGQPYILEEIVDYQTGFDIGYDDNFHYSRIIPSKLKTSDQQQLLHVAKIGVEALGMKNCPAHIEIIMTTNGPRIVEIGARNGGYRERMHGLANGIDMLDNTLRLALGQPPHIKATCHDSCAVLELFPRTPGRFIELKNETELQKLASLTYLSVKAQQDNHIGKSADGYKAAAVIILHNANTEQFYKDLAFVNDNVSIITQPQGGVS